MISVRFFWKFCLPGIFRPAGRARALDARVHVALVVVADIEHAVAALHRARERLQPDIVRAAVAAHRYEAILGVELTFAFEDAVCGLDAGDCGRDVFERVVYERVSPRGEWIDCRDDFHAAGRKAGHEVSVGGQGDLPHRDSRRATCARAMPGAEHVLFLRKFFYRCHLSIPKFQKVIP